ncbi:MAG: twin-arginine translocase TatA/TatE family subunit [bacterium]
MGNLGATEILLIALAILLFFGAKKIPDLMGGLGKGIREFKKASREIDDDVETDVKKIDETKKEKDHV